MNTTYGRPRRAAHRVISSAPGSGRSPLLVRSPSTSVPSMSKTNPRAAASRSRTTTLATSRLPGRTDEPDEPDEPDELSESRNPGLSTTSRDTGGREPSSRSSRSTGCTSGV